MHLLQEVAEEEAEVAEEEVEVVEEEEEAEEDKRTLQPHPTSDSAETPQKYSPEIEKKQTASSLNSNATTSPTLESQNLIHGSERSSLLAPTSKAR